MNHKLARDSFDHHDISSPLKKRYYHQDMSCEDILLVKYCSPRASKCAQKKTYWSTKFIFPWHRSDRHDQRWKHCCHHHALPTVMMVCIDVFSLSLSSPIQICASKMHWRQIRGGRERVIFIYWNDNHVKTGNKWKAWIWRTRWLQLHESPSNP